MKKIICVLLCSILSLTLFSSCSENGSKPSGNGAPEGDELFFQLESLPDVGEYSSRKNVEYFYPDGAQKTFPPSDDYGTLLPYCASVDGYEEISGEGSENYPYPLEYVCSYGLMTDDLRVITGGLWSEFEYHGYNDASGFYFLTGFMKGEGSSVRSRYDVVALDGSWSVPVESLNGIDDLFSFGLPMFILGDGDTCKIFSLDGEEVLDLSGYIERNEEYYDGETDPYIYYNQPKLIYADSDMVLIGSERWEQIDYYNSKLYYYCTALNYKGEELYGFMVEDAYISWLSGGVLFCTDQNTNEATLLDLKGDRFSDAVYTGVYYDAAANRSACIRFDEKQLVLDVLGENGELIKENTFNADSDEYDCLQYYPRSAKNGLVFANQDDGVFCGSDGERIEFDVEGEEIKRVSIGICSEAGVLSLDDAGGNYEIYFCVLTKSNRCFIFAPDGALIRETAFPKNGGLPEDSDDYYMLGIGFENKSVYVFTDEGGLYYYSLTDDRSVSIENEELLKNNDFVYFWELDENFALGNVTKNEEYLPVVFSFKNDKVLYKDAVFSRLFGGYCLIGTKTFTAVLNADGNEVMRIPLGGLA